MKKIIALMLSLIFIVFLLTGCNKQVTVGGSEDIVSVISIQANKVKIVHETEEGKTDFEATITDAKEIENILGIYNSMKIRQMSKPLKAEHFIIIFYQNDTEIAAWRVDSELMTSCSSFKGGNYVIENADFNYSYFEELLNK